MCGCSSSGDSPVNEVPVNAAPVNSPPEIQSITAEPDRVDNGSTLTIKVTATDADGDELTYTWTVPSDYVIQSGDGTDEIVVQARLFAAGNVSVTVDDGIGGEATDSISVSTLPGDWSLPSLLDTSDDSADDPNVVVDRDGNVTAVWEQYDHTHETLWSARYDRAAGIWGPTVRIDTDAEFTDPPRLAVDSIGNVIAVWPQYDGTRRNIWANRYDQASGTWGMAELIETDNAGHTSLPDVSMDPNGNATAVWYQYDGARYNIWSNRYDYASGTWGTAVLIETDDADDAVSPKVAVDANGNATVVWSQSDGTRRNIWSNRYDQAVGMWGTAVLIETDNAGGAGSAKVAVDPDGNATAVWNQSDGTRYNIWSNRYDQASGTWGVAVLIETDNTGGASHAEVAVDPNGNAIAVWSQSDGTRDNIWSNRYDHESAAWGVATLIESENAGHASRPLVAVDPAGNATSVWHQSDGTRNNIWSNRYDHALGTWGMAVLLETDDTASAYGPKLAVDPLGIATVVWNQGSPLSVWANRYE